MVKIKVQKYHVLTPISYKVGDWLYRLLHHSRLPRDEEDAKGEITEDTIEEEVI